ncbi:MAG TPA: PAS domain S-box protein [Gemmatimonadales bacterium]
MLAKHVVPAVTTPRESPETFRLLVEGVQDYAIFMLDGAGRVSTWNSGAERIKGYRAEEIVGQHFSRLYPPEAIAEGKPAQLLGIAARDGRVEDEGWRVRKDGSRFWADVIITALRDSEGSVIGFAKVTRDMTQRRRTEQALAQTNQELERFSYSVSHDLRAPLRAINGYAQALWEDHAEKLGDEGERLLAVIRDSAKLGGQLIDGLLTFSRVGRQALARGTVNVTALAQSVVAELWQTQGSVAVEVVISPLPPASGDAALLRQVLVNLIGNAFKFSAKRAHPKVEIGAEQNGSESGVLREGQWRGIRHAVRRQAVRRVPAAASSR